MNDDVWTLRRVLNWTAGYFDRKGSDTARLDAELLISHALRMSRMQLYTEYQKPLKGHELAAIRALVERRGGGEPVAYLTGQKGFWTIDIEVSPSVLIPRPETELLVELGLKHLQTVESPRVLDLCCGSGCIGLALGHERQDASVLGTDISADALSVASRNRDRLGLTNVDFEQHDGLENISGEYDLLVSNPPYIETAQISKLMPSVREFEPIIALDGGDDGLDFYRRIAMHAPPMVSAKGLILLEIGYDQAESVSALFHSAGFNDVTVHQDLAGLDRVIRVSASKA